MTTYLKGVVIVVVMLSHFGGYYKYLDLGIFANAVSLFFVLSGYGIWHSLERGFAVKPEGDRDARPAGPAAGSAHTARVLGLFFLSRAARIYPLYWLALIATQLYDTKSYQLGGFSYHMLGTVLAVPFTTADGILWFIVAIFQCYLLAPVFYWLVQRLGAVRYLAVCLGLLAVFVPLTYLIASGPAYNSPFVAVYFYREFLLANVILFALGMAIPGLVKRCQAALERKAAALIGAAAAIGFLFFVYVTRNAEGHHYLAVPLVLFAFILCLYLIGVRPRLPASQLFVLIGSLSFSLYLFHEAGFELLKALGILQPHWLVGAGLTLALFPVLLGFCWVVERCFALWRREFGRLFLQEMKAEVQPE